MSSLSEWVQDQKLVNQTGAGCILPRLKSNIKLLNQHISTRNGTICMIPWLKSHRPTRQVHIDLPVRFTSETFSPSVLTLQRTLNSQTLNMFTTTKTKTEISLKPAISCFHWNLATNLLPIPGLKTLSQPFMTQFESETLEFLSSSFIIQWHNISQDSPRLNLDKH